MYTPSFVIWWLKSISFPKDQHTFYPILHSNDKNKQETLDPNRVMHFANNYCNHIRERASGYTLTVNIHPSPSRQLSIPLNPFTCVNLIWTTTAHWDYSVMCTGKMYTWSLLSNLTWWFHQAKSVILLTLFTSGATNHKNHGSDHITDWELRIR